MPRAFRSRRPRYSLRTSLLITAAVAAWLGYNVHLINQRRALLAEPGWYASGRDLAKGTAIPLLRRWMGDQPRAFLVLNRNGGVQDELRRAERLFPEAKVMQIETFKTPEWPAVWHSRQE